MAEKKKKLVRTSGPIFGVCGGIAKYWGVDPLPVRLIFLLLLVGTSFPIALIYLSIELFLMESPDDNGDG